MNRAFTLLAALLFALCTNAQTNKPRVKFDQPYGVIDTADLTMKGCDFEKDANAEVLFDFRKADFEYNRIKVERHIRIKIFNKAGEKYAIVRLPVYKGYNPDVIRSLKAQTINLSGKAIVYTPVEKKYIYKEKTNEYIETTCISLPDIIPGSIFEVSYSFYTYKRSNYPQWFPQGPIPVRFTQMLVNDDSGYSPYIKVHVNQPFVFDTTAVRFNTSGQTRTWALANLHSLKKEEYAGFIEDAMQYVAFIPDPPLNALQVRRRIIFSFNVETGYKLLIDSMLKTLAPMKRQEDKIAYIFNTVKNKMTWTGVDNILMYAHIDKVWERKQGNSTEINMILYDMLTQAGIKCYPLAVSTHNYPRLDFKKLYTDSFNRTVVYVPVDSTLNYILDATSKYNNYKQTPIDLLDLRGMIINDSDQPLQVVSMLDNQPAMQTVIADAEIKGDAKMSGSATITGYSYNKILSSQDIDTCKSDVYKDHLTGGDHSLKITSLKFENMDVDTLPLIQHIDFNYDLGDADGGYIYFKTNLFSSIQKNPFTSNNRISDIYFGYRRFYNIIGDYRLPAGYKVDATPKSTFIIMPDSSITFKRLVGVMDDGSVQVRYTLRFYKSMFPLDEYPALYEFYRKMYEALNEQIVLKKL